MKLTDVLIIIATILGPILAVQAQKWIERLNEERNRRLWIFKTLMATRATTISAAHVEALNMIDTEFCKNAAFDRAVCAAWKEYLDHLDNGPKDTKDPNFSARRATWDSKKIDLSTNLLFEMGKGLGFKFDRVHLKNNVYLPKGHTDLEDDQWAIRKGILEVLQKGRPIVVQPLPEYNPIKPSNGESEHRIKNEKAMDH